jgi:hypothetical protein
LYKNFILRPFFKFRYYATEKYPQWIIDAMQSINIQLDPQPQLNVDENNSSTTTTTTTTKVEN